jgi:hypothetical protein
MIFFVENKTGFCSRDLQVNIYDSTGKPFYHKKNVKGVLFFNLPQGEYETENKLFYLKKPITYSVPKAPKPEKNISFRDLKVNLLSEEQIGGKARIDTIEGQMDLSEKIFMYPKPIWRKIFFHELGHHLYYTEKYCDHFADLCLLKMGYNPSQLFSGTVCSLKPKESNLDRIIYNHRNGMNTKQKYGN